MATGYATDAMDGYGAAIGTAPAVIDPRWSLAFLGVLGYTVVEYTRLAAMYPILQPLALGKLTVATAAVGCLLEGETHRVFPKLSRRIGMVLIALLVVVGVGAFRAEFQTRAWDQTSDVVRWLVIFYVVSRVAAYRWRLRFFLGLWLLLNFKLAQFVVRSFRAARGTYSEMVLVSHGFGAGTTGFFANSADLGVAMCVVWPIATCLLFTRPKPLYKFFLVICSLASMGAILLCGSRGAVVGAAAIAVAVWVKSPKKLAGFLMAAILGLGIWLVLPDASKQRFHNAENPEQDETSHHRLLLWKAGLNMYADNPILGVGIGNYPYVRWKHYPLPDRKLQRYVSVPHSMYIEMISELGTTGALCFLALWVLVFYSNAETRRLIREIDPEYLRSYEFCLSIGLDLGLIGYLASGAFVAVLWYPHTFILLAISTAINAEVHRRYALRQREVVPTEPIEPMVAC